MNVHVLVDQAIGASTRWLQRKLPPKDDTTHLLDQYRGQSLATLFPPPPARPYVETRDAPAVGPLRARRFRIASAHQPLAEPLRRIYDREQEPLHFFHGRELELATRASRRAVVYIHGWMESTDLATEALLAPVVAWKLDADFFHFQLPHHWRRQVAGSKYNGAGFCSADLAQTCEAFRQAVLDARTLLTWVRSLGRYDEIGLMGISLGGLLTQIVACLDPDLPWAVPCEAHLDFQDLVSHAPILTEIRDELAAFGVGPADLEDFVRALGFDRLEPAIDRSRLLFVAALDDQFMRPEAMARALARWPGVATLWIPGGHITALFRLPRVLDDVRRFIDAQPRPARASQA
ncbi:MAG: hypothetical protein U0610_16130 [bacterium]